MEKIKITIEGNEIDEVTLLKKELERAYEALKVLRTRVGNEGISQALKSDTDEMEKVFLDAYEKSPKGEYVKAAVEVEVEGVSAQDWTQYFLSLCMSKDEDVIQDKPNPEHYLIDANAGRSIVIETVGYSKPALFTLRRDPDFSKAPEALDEDTVAANLSFGETVDGRDLGWVAFHQFKNTQKGMLAKLAIYFPSAVDEAIVEGQKVHLAIEFKNWLSGLLKQKGMI